MAIKGPIFYNKSFFIIEEDENLLKENITRILLTLPGERVNNPQFGSRLRLFIFELDSILQEDLKNEILSAINRWEPRVNILDIQTQNVNERAIALKIACQNKDTLEEFDFEKIFRF